MAKYVAGATLSVGITTRVMVQAPLDSLVAPLLLAEVYQRTGRLGEAIGLMQQLDDANPGDDAVRLSLADLLYRDGDDEGLLELAAGGSNTSDATLGLLYLKAKGQLRAGLTNAGLAEFTACRKKTSGRIPSCCARSDTTARQHMTSSARLRRHAKSRRSRTRTIRPTAT